VNINNAVAVLTEVRVRGKIYNNNNNMDVVQFMNDGCMIS
jgi:hypothetical protein